LRDPSDGKDCPFSRPDAVNASYGVSDQKLAAGNIARVKASAAKMLATAKGLQDAIDESRRLINESKALLADRPPPEPVMPLDVIDDWLARLASRPKPG
jgi:hypothetical protein